jgi:hypothetical protein
VDDAGATAGAAGLGGEVDGAQGGDGGSLSGEAGKSSDTGGAGAAPDLFVVSVTRASDLEPSAPGTVGILTFAVPLSSLREASVEFGLDTKYGLSAPVDLDAPGHRTLLLGMKPTRTYHLRVVVSDGYLTYRSRDYTFETGPAPTSLPFAGITVASEAWRERGFIVTSYLTGPGKTIPFIIDADGEIVWWREVSVQGVARAAMSATGKNLWAIRSGSEGGPLVRVGMDGLEAQQYDGTVGSHDITPVTDETMAFLEHGEADCDSVFEIDPSGATREIFESQGVVGARCHANAIRYSATEDIYTYSDRLEDLLGLSRSGEVLWRLSERVPGGHATWGGAQHGHHLLDSSLVIFANDGVSATVSAAIEYDFGGRELRRFQSGYYSGIMGDVQRLPQGNTLVTFSAASIIQEFTHNGEIVVELDGGGPALGYATWRPTLYGPPPTITL